MVMDGPGRVRHGLQEGVVLRVPELVHVPGPVDILLAPGGGDADGDVLQRAAEAAHGVALEVGQHQQGVVVLQVRAHIVLLDHLAGRDGQLHVPVPVQDVHRGGVRPAVLLHGLPVGGGGVPAPVIGGVALHDGAVHRLDHGLHQVGADEVLVPRLAGVELHRHLALQLHAQGGVQPEQGLRGELAGEIYLGIHNRLPPAFICDPPHFIERRPGSQVFLFSREFWEKFDIFPVQGRDFYEIFPKCYAKAGPIWYDRATESVKEESPCPPDPS